MESYTAFASVYDTFMSDIPYGKWHGYLHGLLKEYGITEGTVADLGCGTGTMTGLLADSGYDMIGIDSSIDMLAEANEKKIKLGHNNIFYIHQDIRALELYGSLRAAVSVCDSLNYITEPEDLIETFRRVNYYLDNDGIFVFDFKTDYFYRKVLGDRVIAEAKEDCSYIWDNYYYEDEKINEYELSIFIRDRKHCDKDELFRRFKETHYQRGYTLEEAEELVGKSGLKLLASYDAFTRNAPHSESERIYMIAGKGK